MNKPTPSVILRARNTAQDLTSGSNPFSQSALQEDISQSPKMKADNSSEKIGLANVTFMTVGAMIGSAIFSLSGVTIAFAGFGAIFSWLLAGLILLAYGLICTYLAKNWPEIPGMYAIPSQIMSKLPFRMSKNPLFSRFWGLIGVIFYAGGCISGSLFSAQYIGLYGVELLNSLGFTQIPEFVPTLLGIASCVVVYILCLVKLKQTGRFNAILTVMLCLLLLSYVLTILFSGHQLNFDPTSFSLSDTFSSIPVAMLAYGGIVVPAFIINSLKGGSKSAKNSQIISMSITLLIYLLALIATIGVINTNVQAFLDNPEMQYMPFNFALETIGLSQISPIITIAALIALFTTQLVVSRMAVVAVGEITKPLDRRVNSKLESLDKNSKLLPQTLVPSLIVTFILIVGILAGVITDYVIEIGASFNTAFIVLVVICAVIHKAFAMRRTPPSTR
jgi:APA family basic amino acid/polyamine antiporter